VWESGKEYVVSGDVMVEAGVTLTLQPDVVVTFVHDRADCPDDLSTLVLNPHITWLSEREVKRL